MQEKRNYMIEGVVAAKKDQVPPEAPDLPDIVGEIKTLACQLCALREELLDVERQRGIFIGQRDEFEAETKRLYRILAEKDRELQEVERQRDIFLQQRDGFEAETKRLYAGHVSMEEEINFWKSRHDATSELHERVVQQKWSGEQPYGDYCCVFPFERIEILPRGEVYCCCSGYLKSGYTIGNIYTDDIAQMWNSDKMKKLRYAVSMGDFEYCQDHCVWLTNCSHPSGEDILNPMKRKNEVNLLFSRWQDCTVNQSPKIISLSCDESCNLQCPSCRSCKKILSNEQSQKLFQMLMEKVWPNLFSCRRLDLLGSGEVFASAACLDFLKTLTAERFPKLSIRMITNALLFTEARWAELENIHDMPLFFDISLDAANKETYEALRIGGKWEVLCQNMKLISKLRKAGNIQRLALNFVVQKENYQQILAFVELGKQWSADVINYQFMTNWGTLSRETYEKKNVLLPQNPCYQKATALLQLAVQSKGIRVLQNSPVWNRNKKG